MGLTLNPENSSEESFEVHLIGENEREEHLSISAHATGREWPWGIDCPAFLVRVCQSAV